MIVGGSLDFGEDGVGDENQDCLRVRSSCEISPKGLGSRTGM
jgi:hypothetical protein